MIFYRQNKILHFIKKEMEVDRLKKINQIALETESVGIDILINLQVQKEQISYINLSLDKANSNIDKSTKILKKMNRWWITNFIIDTYDYLVGK